MHLSVFCYHSNQNNIAILYETRTLDLHVRQLATSAKVKLLIHQSTKHNKGQSVTEMFKQL